MNTTAALTRDRELQLLQKAIGRADSEGLQVLLRDPESRAITCALCNAESDHPSMIRHAANCPYAKSSTIKY